MHPDKKVGLALGILLIGITGAFFFRNDAPVPAQETLTLTDPEALDRKVSQKPGAPYFPEPSADENEEQSELADVPESSAADVIPGLPRVGPTGRQGMLAGPISVTSEFDSAEQFADRMAPLPTPGQDLDSLENVLARHADAGAGDRSLEQVNSILSDDVDSEDSLTDSEKIGERVREAQSAFITHEVVAGDNLSKLAKKYLGSHSKYLTLYEANKDVLASPDALAPGMKLKIPRQSSDRKSTSRKSSTSSSKSAAVESRKSPSFVQPDRASVIALGGGRRSGRGLSQAPPPNLPRVEGLNPGGDPAVIASRPKR